MRFAIRIVRQHSGADCPLDGTLIAHYEPWELLDPDEGSWGASVAPAGEGRHVRTFKSRLDAIRWAYRISPGHPLYGWGGDGPADRLSRPLPDTFVLDFIPYEEAA